MRTLTLALLLALAAPAARAADVYTFKPIHAAKGSTRPFVLTVQNEDRTARDVSTATGTITVYSAPPVGGTGGTVMFAKTLSPTATTGQMTAAITAQNTATPGVYYCEIAIVDGAITDTWAGSWVTEGR